MNAIKNGKSQNTAELKQVSSQSAKSVYMGHYLSCATAPKSHNLPINLSSFTQNTIRSTSQLLYLKNRKDFKSGEVPGKQGNGNKGRGLPSAVPRTDTEEQLPLHDCKEKDREANSLSKKCIWVVKWRQETFLGCSFMDRVTTSINLKPNTYFILIHPVAFELQYTCNWVRNPNLIPFPGS